MDRLADLFSLVILAWLQCIAGELNTKAIPKLLTLNSISQKLAPKFVPGSVEKEDVKGFIDGVWKLAPLPGMLDADDKLRDKIRTMLNIEKVDPKNPGTRIEVPPIVPERGKLPNA